MTQIDQAVSIDFFILILNEYGEQRTAIQINSKCNLEEHSKLFQYLCIHDTIEHRNSLLKTTALSEAGVRETTALSEAGVRETTALSEAGVCETTALSEAGVRETTALSEAGVRKTNALSESGVRETNTL